MLRCIGMAYIADITAMFSRNFETHRRQPINLVTSELHCSSLLDFVASQRSAKNTFDVERPNSAYGNSSGDGFISMGLATLLNHGPSVSTFWDPNLRPHGMTYNHQILLGDRRVNFYRIYHVPTLTTGLERGQTFCDLSTYAHSVWPRQCCRAIYLYNVKPSCLKTHSSEKWRQQTRTANQTL